MKMHRDFARLDLASDGGSRPFTRRASHQPAAAHRFDHVVEPTTISADFRRPESALLVNVDVAVRQTRGVSVGV